MSGTGLRCRGGVLPGVAPPIEHRLMLGTAGQFALDEFQKRIDLVFVITPSPDPRLGERRISNIRWGDTTWGRRISQRCFDTVEERIDLVFVVAAFSDRWIREGGVADLLCRQPIAGGLVFLTASSARD
jgi:hypothetical protein